MSILFLVNKHINYQFSTGAINELYPVLIDYGFMDEECFIRDPAAIFNTLGLPVHYYDRFDPPDYRCKDKEIEILRFKHNTWVHFVAGDGESHVTYDPWGLSKAVQCGNLLDKRVFLLLR